MPKNRLVFPVTIEDVSNRLFEKRIMTYCIQHTQYESLCVLPLIKNVDGCLKKIIVLSLYKHKHICSFIYDVLGYILITRYIFCSKNRTMSHHF